MKYRIFKNNILKKLVLLVFILCFSLLFAQEDEKNNEFLFKFKFIDGDAYKVHSVVDEKVYVNGKFHHQAHIINRIEVEVSDIQPAEADEPASALFSCMFMTSEQNSNKTFDWSRNYPSVFRRDEAGFYSIGDEYFMPVVRNVPAFPNYPVKPGDTWQGEGFEAHDFRDAFGIENPFTFPFEVEYQYIGLAEIDGQTYRHITASYDLNHLVPQEVLKNYKGKIDVPIKILGKSRQNLYWDEERGNLFCYNEEFNIKMFLYSGYTYDFIGTARAEVIEVKKIDTSTEEEIKKSVEDLNLENTTIEKTDEGLTISIENIQFLPNSAVLRDSEKEKLKKIGEILSKFSDRELLISGHTALAGTEKERQKLSEERAAAVANYLIELGVQEREHVYTRGFGARRPVAANNSPENMAKNRRVEITILDK
ncbi:OmpA family protein [Treponema sp. OMZ 788]|uniref:OmpA family protein n=1 Tax=Treponema sp. OMZ 788 TaxID=2563664 RepID=UPI0020A5CC3C|nr:OmpA family protein [Treponema sp. OMZ 788]UTC64246.1 OmpA family protein [Treponema sp. OMZ 788]